MTVNEMGKVIGKQGMLKSETTGVEFAVTILDVKWSYGQLRYAISPVNGKGVFWVNENKVRVEAHHATVLP